MRRTKFLPLTVIDTPLTNLQLELLKLFSLDLSDDELLEVKRLIAGYFADRASDEMDRMWEEMGWTDETMDEWLKDDSEKEIS